MTVNVGGYRAAKKHNVDNIYGIEYHARTPFKKYVFLLTGFASVKFHSHRNVPVPTPRVNADQPPVHWRSKGLYFDAVLIVVATENLPRKMPHEKVTDSINSNETQGLTVKRKKYTSSFLHFLNNCSAIFSTELVKFC